MMFPCKLCSVRLQRGLRFRWLDRDCPSKPGYNSNYYRRCLCKTVQAHSLILQLKQCGVPWSAVKGSAMGMRWLGSASHSQRSRQWSWLCPQHNVLYQNIIKAISCRDKMHVSLWRATLCSMSAYKTVISKRKMNTNKWCNSKHESRRYVRIDASETRNYTDFNSRINLHQAYH